MRFGRFVSLLALFGLLAPSGSTSGMATESRCESEKSAAQLRGARQASLQVKDFYQRLPLLFEENRGQAGEETVFLARGRYYDTYLTRRGVMLAFKTGPPAKSTAQTDVDSADPTPTGLRMWLAGARDNPKIGGEDRLPGVSNYFIGDDPKKWRTNVPSFSRIRYEEIYPGIDLLFYGSDGHLEYDLILSPSADPQVVQLNFEGADRLEIEESGDLLIFVGKHQFQMHSPSILQSCEGAEKKVAGGYFLKDPIAVGFRLGEYDRKCRLAIDPVLSYSTYLAGSRGDGGRAVAVDDFGFLYVFGRTQSLNFPLSNSLSQNLGGFSDMFLMKMNPEGSQVVYSTYIGGSGSEDLFEVSGDLQIDRQGNIYLTGDTESADFPVVNAFQPELKGTADAFVVKVDPSGSSLVFSTYLGGSKNETGFSLAVDETGDVYVAGGTQSADFPTVNPAQQDFAGGFVLASDCFVAKLKSDGSALVYATYIGGSMDDVCFGIDLDGAGNAYLAGGTASADFPAVNAFQSTFGGGSRFLLDAFVTKLNPQGNAFLYSTFLGGSADDVAFGVAVNDASQAYVTGATTSADFPTANPLQATLAGGGWHGSDAFISRLSSDGGSLESSTFLGGSPGIEGVGDDAVLDVVLDADGNVYLTGATSAADFPTGFPFQAVFSSYRKARADGFVTKLDPTCSQILFSSYLGGGDDDFPFGMAVDTSGSIYVTGVTHSTDFPTAHAMEPTFKGGGRDGFLVRIAETKELFFAHFGDGSSQGASVSSLITLFNLSPTQAARATLEINDDEGNPLTVDLNGNEVNGRIEVMIPPDGSVNLETDGQGPLKTGSVIVTTNGEISGVILFRGFGVAGVLANQRLRKFRAPMRTGGGLNSGVALMGLGPEQTIDLELLDGTGQVVARVKQPLKPKGHIARFLTEFQWDSPPDFSKFVGTLSATSNEDFAATVILVTSDEFATLPVKISEEPEVFFFAQFGDGTQDGASLSSQITLFNLSSDKPVTASLLIRDDDGNLLTVDLNGNEVEGFIAVQVPPGNVVILDTDGEGTLKVGSVTVFSDRRVSGGSRSSTTTTGMITSCFGISPRHTASSSNAPPR
ncbi:SBBP repeat-containing protein [Acidobacteria bacterium AH-259-O06]|nr:SBBP repeat-containing protein [Acidobacteria bacterium AH-259-O06]